MSAKNQSPSSRFAFEPFCKQLFFCAEIEGNPRPALVFTLLLASRPQHHWSKGRHTGGRKTSGGLFTRSSWSWATKGFRTGLASTQPRLMFCFLSRQPFPQPPEKSGKALAGARRVAQSQ